MQRKQAAARLYPYQARDIEAIFDKINGATGFIRFVYQLPTGGGKTMVFAEIARRFIEKFNRSVTVLTHRKELCRQTSATLRKTGVTNTVIGSSERDFSPSDCYVAMVETLRNRIKSRQFNPHGVGLVIIDEAHHNSFRKLLGKFKNAFVIGVTATPFSSDITKPMNRHYQGLVTGESITNLIAGGFLAKPEPFAYEVELNSLKTGLHGDYTVSSSNHLYGSPVMLELLLKAYRERAEGRKTLIFNNGIEVSLKVHELFKSAGIAVRHLDNKTPDAARKETLLWFKKTKGAVLTSVSILTTGFDEPTVEAVVLNRATTSITLYHQMIGRGSRRLPSKRTFRIIDLGNNIQRFGHWDEPIDWQFVFEKPLEFAQKVNQTGGSPGVQSHAISAELRALFPNTLEMAFDIEGHYQEALDNDQKPKSVIRESIRQQALMCLENSETASQALELANALRPEIEWRVKQYVKCLDKASKSYKDWLLEHYCETLGTMIRKLFARVHKAA